ncbi:MAG: hypothetical protein KAS78_01430 [Candidatus Pacebacteria bacterium]|nr:hypothetical protein [Candidatus Paceibacterota bacterium]
MEADINELIEVSLDSSDPVNDLRERTTKIYQKNKLILALNIINFSYDKKIYFKEHWSREIRRAYRRKLASIFHDMEDNRNEWSNEKFSRILNSLESEYKELNTKENVLNHYPCKEGKIKIARKLEVIAKIKKETPERIS